MDVILTPTKLNGTVTARPSAVSTCLHNAAMQLATMHEMDQRPRIEPGDTLSRRELSPSDMDAISRIIDALPSASDRVDCGDSTTALMFTLPLAAAIRGDTSFIGNLTMDPDSALSAEQILSRHGVAFSRGDLKIKRRDRKKIQEIKTLSGKLQYGDYSLVGREDPWFLSGLLFSLPLLEGNSTIRMTTLPESSELADITVGILRQYGIIIDASVDDYGYPYYRIAGSQTYTPPAGVVPEGDWTGAAFWLVCGSLGGNVTVKGLRADSSQSSRLILDKLHTMGAAAGMGEGGANVTAVSLSGCNISAGLIPDLIPFLSVAMASASGTSTLTDIGDFDPEPVVQVLDSLGANPFHEGSSLRFEGKPFLTGGDVDPKGDPTAILVAAAASCVCSESVLIRGAGAINKYYPGFFDIFESLGGRIRVLP